MKTERRAVDPGAARASAGAPRANIQLNDIALFVEVARRGSFSPVSYTHLDVYKRQPGRRW